MFIVAYVAVDEDGHRYYKPVEGLCMYDYKTAINLKKRYPDSDVYEARLAVSIQAINVFSVVRFEATEDHYKLIQDRECKFIGGSLYVYNVPCKELHKLCKKLDLYNIDLLTEEYRQSHLLMHGSESYGDAYYRDNNIEVTIVEAM